jgi:hypothetical protein
LVEAIDEHNMICLASKKAVAELKVCSGCNRPTVKSNECNGKILCQDCLDSDYSTCDECGVGAEDNELTDVGDYHICNSCLGKLTINDFDHSKYYHEDEEILGEEYQPSYRQYDELD